MRPTEADVDRMIRALFAVNADLNRARRQSPGTARLAILWSLVEPGGVRPTEIARRLQVTLSVVTRHVQALEDQSLVAVERDGEDHRSCRVSLTPTGEAELDRLQQIEGARYAGFVAGWDAAEVTTLTRLLEKFEWEKEAVARTEAARWRRASWLSG